jgi:hypothetical protein
MFDGTIAFAEEACSFIQNILIYTHEFVVF